jgi:nucleoside-diphosphate-sugar epimerase
MRPRGLTHAGGADFALTGIGLRRLIDESWRVAIVGAGGWMGLATVDLLKTALGDRFDQTVACFGSVERDLVLRSGESVRQRTLSELTLLAPAPTLVLHYAYLTQEKAAGMSASAYAAANRAISKAVFDALDPIGAEAVFIASSGAVYMADQAEADAQKRLYGALKLEDEGQFSNWARDRQARTVIARIFGLSGPYINKVGAYALASFITDVLAERPIEIRASRPVYRSLVALDELMSVVFGALTDPAPGVTVFDTADEREYEMGELAASVAWALDHKGGVRRPDTLCASPERYVGDGADYRRLRQRFGVRPTGFDDHVRQTAMFMAQCERDGLCRSPKWRGIGEWNNRS